MVRHPAVGKVSFTILRAWHRSRRLQAGTVWINTYKQVSISTPSGGTKASGVGIERASRNFGSTSARRACIGA